MKSAQYTSFEEHYAKSPRLHDFLSCAMTLSYVPWFIHTCYDSFIYAMINKHSAMLQYEASTLIPHLYCKQSMSMCICVWVRAILQYRASTLIPPLCCKQKVSYCMQRALHLAYISCSICNTYCRLKECKIFYSRQQPWPYQSSVALLWVW